MLKKIILKTFKRRDGHSGKSKPSRPKRELRYAGHRVVESLNNVVGRLVNLNAIVASEAKRLIDKVVHHGNTLGRDLVSEVVVEHVKICVQIMISRHIRINFPCCAKSFKGVSSCCHSIYNTITMWDCNPTSNFLRI